MIDLQTVSVVLTGVSVSLAAIFYVYNIRNANRTRQAQLFMQLFQHNITRDWMEDWWELVQMQWGDIDDFYRKYDASVNVDNFAKRFRAWFFLDSMGTLLKKGLVDREMVYHLMSGFLGYWLWEKFGDVIKDQRKQYNVPELCVMFEYLAKEMTRMREDRGHPKYIPDS